MGRCRTRIQLPVFDDAPRLDGTLHLDAATRQMDSRDLGRMVEQLPCAVLRPGSVADIAMIRYCRRHGIKVAMRGQGHTMYGQSLVGGLLIENRSLQTIHSIGPGGADVDAGVFVRRKRRFDPENILTPGVGIF